MISSQGASSSKQESPDRGPGRLVAVSFLLYALISILTINQGYIDFGDGNYLYISWRLTQGVRLYSEILSPQPPLHLLVGRTLISLGEQMGGGMLTIYIVRIFSILLHLLTGWLVLKISDRLFGDRWVSALSAAIYVFLPVGFFWAKGYQSEPLEIVFLCLGFYGLLLGTSGGLVLGGLCGALSLFTNMTAVPYVALWVVYVLVSRRGQLMHFLLPLVGVCGVMLGYFYYTAGDAYLQNVFFNQVGSFHRTDPLGYAVGKIISQSGNVLLAQGGFVLCAVLGAILYLSQESLKVHRVAVWYFFWGLGSIVFVSKGGTQDYIFSLAEPMIAVFSAFFLRFFYLGTFSAWMAERASGLLSDRLTRAAALLTLALVLCARGSWELFDTLSQGKYENPSWGVQRVVDYIEHYAEPGETIWAPPYYAFLVRRPIVEDASETFIWFIRHLNQSYFGDDDPQVVELIRNIISQLDGEQVPVVILNLRPGQLGAIPEIRQAVEQHYTLVDDQIRSRNEDLRVYISRKKVPTLNF